MASSQQKPTLIQCLIASLPYALVIPSILLTLYLFDIILLTTLKIGLVIFFVIFVVGPLIYKYCYAWQRSVIFLNFVNLPSNPNYSNPSEYDLNATHNFYLTTQDNISLGVWHILPEEFLNLVTSPRDETYFRNALKNAQNVVMYNHGNSGNRAASHRVELYRLLRKNYHVIAFDYRGYGDSSHVEPSEGGLASDSKYVFKWLRSKTSGNIFVWGHSLGTAVSIRSIAELNSESLNPAGLILESPFNNMRDEIMEHPLAKAFRYLPWFNYTIIEPMLDNNLSFQSDLYIKNVDCPILILHAEDDGVVPFHLGKKLFQAAHESRLERQGKIEFRSFAEKERYGHKFICRAPELECVIKDFVSRSLGGSTRKNGIAHPCVS